MVKDEWSATRAVNPARDIQTRRPVSRYSELERSESEAGAGDGLRTRYLDLGKVALYQVSYSRSDRGSILPVSAHRSNQADAGSRHA